MNTSPPDMKNICIKIPWTLFITIILSGGWNFINNIKYLICIINYTSFHRKDNMSQKSQISKSLEEELAETRDLKRRRTKYKVTTKSKAYTEIIRDVIDSQVCNF